jgi:cation diffusion facilitator CzcD-associated flavoprotein CzcO
METEHVDVLIVGAGLSGIGAACQLRRNCPTKSLAVLEARASMGGTWDLFRYPGVRSDSDMFTLGYSFAPWGQDQSIARGASILDYIGATAREYGVEEAIRYGHRVMRADWSSAEGRWSVQATRADSGDTVTMTCNFLYACTGYYRYDEGYTPHFEGIERFRGEIVHPQHWPADLDCAGKRVVVIGSGATAVTLVPALAESAEHVTMLQRSPSYILSIPSHDPLAASLGPRLSAELTYSIVRFKNVLATLLIYEFSRRAPKLMRRLIRRLASRQLPPGFDIDKHLNPRYDPWDQRLCLVPDSDLFETLRGGRASIATDEIEAFTETGITLRSGAHLDADVVVTATGLNLLVLGGLEMTVDAVAVDSGKAVVYKSMMLGGVPNMAFTFGYTNASWTLRADLVAEYVCRLLKHMDANGFTVATPQAPDPSLPTEPFLDLTSGYVQRSLDVFPKQGAMAPWRVNQNYVKDLRLLKHGPVDDAIDFSATRRPESSGSVGPESVPVAA